MLGFQEEGASKIIMEIDLFTVHVRRETVQANTFGSVPVNDYYAIKADSTDETSVGIYFVSRHARNQVYRKLLDRQGFSDEVE